MKFINFVSFQFSHESIPYHTKYQVTSPAIFIQKSSSKFLEVNNLEVNLVNSFLLTKGTSLDIVQGVFQPQLHTVMMKWVSAFPPNNCTDFICIFSLASFTGFITHKNYWLNLVRNLAPVALESHVTNPILIHESTISFRQIAQTSFVTSHSHSRKTFIFFVLKIISEFSKIQKIIDQWKSTGSKPKNWRKLTKFWNIICFGKFVFKFIEFLVIKNWINYTFDGSIRIIWDKLTVDIWF